jgi:drug/metabolite transporter (DMT)-like permease
MFPSGALFCLASAAAFGAMGVVGKLAYEEGATVGTLLAVRFVLAAALLWLFLVCAGRAGEVRALARRDVAIVLALGSVGYSAQAGCAFAALERLDASLFSLLLYTFPVFVTVAAVALRREPASRRTAAALALASTGLVIVLAGPSRERWTPSGRCSRWWRRSSTAPTSSVRRASPRASTRSC